ncbi:MAG TPA: DUF5947 family protein [Ktedonobacteraceae bacterium]|nr:DUF5947 family protein [Ktedonobacteraceae bacterium]
MPAPYLSNDGDNGSSIAPVDVASMPALRGFAQRRREAQMEHCELCSEGIPASHSHLLNLSNRALVCVCQACSLLFSEQGAGAGKYLLVPRRYQALVDFQMADDQWDDLMIPVNMAFIFRSGGAKPVMAYYPSPAGATESLLDLEGWQALVNNNPVLNTLAPDVEALLINRIKDVRAYYIVPIDACYHLVGLIRLSWRGLGGGKEVWEAVAGYFQDVQRKAQPVFVKGVDHA